MLASTSPGPTAAGCRIPRRERRRRVVGVVDAIHRPGNERRQHGGRQRQRPRRHERPLVVHVGEHPFAEHGTHPEPAEHGDREVARALGAAVGWRQIGDQRDRSDEQRRLADPRDPSQNEQHRQRPRHPGDRAAGGGEHGATHHQPAPAESVAEPCDERPGGNRRRRERGDRQPDAELAGIELVLDEQRDGHERDPDAREEHQCHRRHGDERQRDEA